MTVRGYCGVLRRIFSGMSGPLSILLPLMEKEKKGGVAAGRVAWRGDRKAVNKSNEDHLQDRSLRGWRSTVGGGILGMSQSIFVTVTGERNVQVPNGAAQGTRTEVDFEIQGSSARCNNNDAQSSRNIRTAHSSFDYSMDVRFFFHCCNQGATFSEMRCGVVGVWHHLSGSLFLLLLSASPPDWQQKCRTQGNSAQKKERR
ncbi:hypothetical protein BC827DRAFT_946784 [Russula dissimulans]|nr:hypothetical protein BC827DRAFT_946784 [Russula dissimulans]